MTCVSARSGSKVQGRSVPSIRDELAGLTPAKRRHRLEGALTGKQAPEEIDWTEEIERLKKVKGRLRATATPKGKSAKRMRDMQKELDRLIEVYRRLAGDVPSHRWFLDADEEGAEFPPGKSERPARHGARMKMSTVSGRYTPPHNLSDEDGLDGMSPHEADAYSGPSSCGSVVCWRNV